MSSYHVNSTAIDKIRSMQGSRYQVHEPGFGDAVGQGVGAKPADEYLGLGGVAGGGGCAGAAGSNAPLVEDDSSAELSAGVVERG